MHEPLPIGLLPACDIELILQRFGLRQRRIALAVQGAEVAEGGRQLVVNHRLVTVQLIQLGT